MDDLKIRLVLEGADQVQAGANRAADGLKKVGQQAQQSGQQAQLTGNQMAQVSAQLQDFFIQIQGGQAPLTAFLQQGSQMTSVFGGVGGALRAVGGFASSLINPFTLAAGAVGLLGYAFLEGDSEARAFSRSLVLTGNAADITVGQLQALAGAQMQVIGTQGEAAQALNALAASGKVSATALASASEAATRLARVGIPLEDTAKKFAALGKDPLKALLELNQAENFLTESVYRQVRALTDRGRVTEAAVVAQEAYARVSIERAKTLSAQLGIVEKSWKAVGDAAKGAWDRILNVGREESTETALAKIDAQIAAAQEKIAKARSGELTRDRPFLDAERIAAAQERYIVSLREQAEPLREVLRLQSRDLSAKEAAKVALDGLIKADEQAADAVKKLAAARDQEAAAYERVMGLSGSYQKDLQQLMAFREKGKLTEEQYVAAVQKLITAQPVVAAQMQAQATIAQAVADAEERGLEIYARKIEALTQSGDAVAKQVLKLQDEEQALALSITSNTSLAEAVERVTIARLEEARAKALALNDEGTAAALSKEIEQRERLASLVGRKEAREAAKRGADDAAREWKRASDEIERSLTDALMRGFENGKGFGQNLRDTLVNMFNTLVLRPVIQGVVQLGMGSLGLGGYANAVAGVAGGQGQANSLMNLYSTGAGLYSAGSSLYTVGSQYLAGSMSGANAAGTLYANATGTGLDGLLATNGAYGTAGGSTSASMATIGWIAAAVLGVMKASSDYSEGYNVGGAKDVTRSLFGSSFGPETARAGLLSSLGVSDRWASILSGSTALAKIFGRAAPVIQASGVDGVFQAGDYNGQAFADMFSKGGLFRSNKSWTEFQAIPQELSDVLDSGAKAVLKEAQVYAETLGLPVAKLLTINSQARIQLGADNEANQKAILDALGAYGNALADGFKESVAPFAKAGETVSATIARLTGLQVFSNNLNTLGGVFSSLAGSSVAAREAMITLVGGMDVLGQQALAFVQNYYNRDEIAGLKAKELQTAFGAAGIDANVSTREQYRALVESLNPESTVGREQLALLLSMQGSFATVADYLAETGQTLSQAAALAPASDLLSPLLSTTSQQLQLAQQSMDAQMQTRDATLQMVNGIEQVVALLKSGGSNGSTGWVPGYRTPEVGLA